MKIKTSVLTGAALDWAVAKLLGHKVVEVPGRGACHFLGVQVNHAHGGYELMPFRLATTLKIAADADYPGVFLKNTWYWRPSFDWSQGGPIIDRIKGAKFKRWLESSPKTAYEFRIHNYEGNWIQSGPTLLIAAMRCYVASKLGDEVDVPEELV